MNVVDMVRYMNNHGRTTRQEWESIKISLIGRTPVVDNDTILATDQEQQRKLIWKVVCCMRKKYTSRYGLGDAVSSAWDAMRIGINSFANRGSDKAHIPLVKWLCVGMKSRIQRDAYLETVGGFNAYRAKRKGKNTWSTFTDTNQENLLSAKNRMVGYLDDLDIKDRFARLLNKIKCEDRRAFVATYIEHLSCAEIASEIGVSKRNVERHISAARTAVGLPRDFRINKSINLKRQEPCQNCEKAPAEVRSMCRTCYAYLRRTGFARRVK